jgi:choline dehydrogenase
LSFFPSDWPEVEYVVNAGGGSLEAVNTGGQNYATIGILLISTVSRGKVTIRSNSMLDKPVMSTNWLLEKTDQEMAVQAYRRAREIWRKLWGGKV